AINSTETPVKEKHARRIILGTHREKGAYTFWSYAQGFPLASSSILGWKFCHVLHKILRDGHHNVLQDCMRHHSSLVEVGKLWGQIHDKYGQLVVLYTKLLCKKLEFHSKHAEIPPNLEVTDEVLERTAGSDVSNTPKCGIFFPIFDYFPTVLRQLNSSIAVSSLTSGQCRLAPLIQVIQDSSQLYHFTVKLLFKLHACKNTRHPQITLHGSGIFVYLLKSNVQLYFPPALNGTNTLSFCHQSPPNFLHAASLAKHVKPVVVIPDDDEPEQDEDDEPEPLVEVSHTSASNVQTQPQVWEPSHRCFQQNCCDHKHDYTFVIFVCSEKAQATEQRYNKLKEKHTELVASHAELLRRRFHRPCSRREPFPDGHLRLSHLSSMTALQAEKERLMRSVSEKEAELSSLRQASQLQQSSLQQERERSSRELGDQEEQMKKKLLEEQFALLQGAIAEAENIIQDAAAKLDDPLHIRCTSSPDYLINRAEATLSSIDKVKKGHADYLHNMFDAGGLLRALTQFSHLAADTIVNGSATAHMAPTDHADRLTENCRSCATQSLDYLKDLKSKDTLQKADPASVRIIVQKILHLGQELRPKGMDIRQEELGDLVDKEMAATSAAIEEAVRRIDEMMNQARKDTSGVKLEVNERILFSCTDLMKAIRMLIIASTDLQKEIVEGGRGAASIKEFYARNSRWTEGLISAAKAVGWGASELVDSADKVVLHMGKYEELIVCSHEIAASTAQLVAASKVKADRNSTKLTVLQQASRLVNEMAANVVASTKTGQENLDDKETMDFSGMSLIKLKKEEMESQVKVLELETQLENERLRLGELRKKHYDLAGVPSVKLGNHFVCPCCCRSLTYL
uniref:Huntingtin interacting protein 1 related b n=1 Tax=Nothobranchius furzeri TaxID=105023 RepID=A0A8C6Q1I6_NOTFU